MPDLPTNIVAGQPDHDGIHNAERTEVNANRARLAALEAVHLYERIQDEGSDEPQRLKLNFVGAGVDVTDDSTNGRTNVVITGGTTTTPRPQFLTVASNDAPADFKAGADYVCDGTGDEAEINTALQRAAPLQSRNANMPAAGQQLGRVQLSGGRFNCANPIVTWTGVDFSGVGWLSEVRAIANNGTGLIKLGNVNDHLTSIHDLYLYGNFGSGGTCNAIDLDMTGSVSASGVSNYPSSSPDSYHMIRDVFIDGFTGGTRHGVHIWSTTTTKNRGNMVSRLQIRNCSGDGIWLSAASDSFISDCHVGTMDGAGYRIATGNTKLANCKSFFCDAYGFVFTSGRCTVTGCESQDDFVGFYFNASPTVGNGLTCDTSSDAGIIMSSTDVVLTGFNIFNRSGGRYATQTRGLWVDAAFTDLTMVGKVEPARITTPFVGTANVGARSFSRVSDGTTLHAVG